ncbi:MAG: hypothetical protein M3R30_09240 [Candidatus Eremiobacteraeota bacterium]|nr:hypothetical protein [Candidatus Eremiobacteraeota bacterium]
MNIPTLILAVASASNVLAAHDFKVTLPAGTTVHSQNINFQTSGYVVVDKATGKDLVGIVDGGGAGYNLDDFKVVCLNGYRAWTQGNATTGAVVAGEPGARVSITWSDLSPSLGRKALAIGMSLHMSHGVACKSKI